MPTEKGRYTKEYVKNRSEHIYPPAPIKEKIARLSEQTGMSKSQIYTEGAKLFMQQHENRR